MHWGLALRSTFYKFIVQGSQVQDPIHLEFGLRNVALQLAPSMGRAHVLVSAMVNHGGIKFLSARVPREDHFGGGACYTEASPSFPRIHSYSHNSASAQGYSSRYWLRGKGCYMGHSSRGFWRQVYAPYIFQGASSRRSSNPAWWIPIGKNTRQN